MQHVGHQLEAVDQPRTGAREVGGGVDGDDARGAEPRQRAGVAAGLLGGARGVVAARHHHHDLRARRVDRLPRRLLRVLAREAEDVAPAGQLDQLRRPVPGDEDGVQPLERGHRHPICVLDRDAHPVDPGALAADEVQRRIARPGGLGDRADVAHRLPERVRIERDDPGPARDALGDLDDVLVGDGAHLAQLLSDDEVRSQVAQAALIELVDRQSLLGALAHGRVDLARAEPRGQHVARDVR